MGCGGGPVARGPQLRKVQSNATKLPLLWLFLWAFTSRQNRPIKCKQSPIEKKSCRNYTLQIDTLRPPFHHFTPREILRGNPSSSERAQRDTPWWLLLRYYRGFTGSCNLASTAARHHHHHQSQAQARLNQPAIIVKLIIDGKLKAFASAPPPCFPSLRHH